jgi:EAL domain-containing protein (putative c-di-GMP-specific phosphodiesterase class I)
MASFARFVAEALKEGYHITATGIESEEHALFAQSQHVQSLEGYYFGRPVDQDDFVMDVTYGADKEKSAHSA